MADEPEDGTKTILIYVALLDEGVNVRRPTEAVDLGNGLFRLLPAADYDPEDEIWEFLPGTVVRTATRRDEHGDYLVAVKA